MDLPTPFARSNISHSTKDFSKLMQIVNLFYYQYVEIEKVVSPYNSRQRVVNKVYMPPSRDNFSFIKNLGLPETLFFSMIGSTIKFCEKTKGQRALITPNPSTHHSIQLSKPYFDIQSASKNNKMQSIELFSEHYELVTDINISRAKFIIVRPKLGKSGAPSASNWEILFFDKDYQYIPEWVDSHLNPKWAGQIH